MTKVTPFLMFNDQLEAAMEFYTTTFPDSEIKKSSVLGRLTASATSGSSSTTLQLPANLRTYFPRYIIRELRSWLK
jgi:predicted 3-demethylubiquinone-9 3-methyltransferase (glyoxalase superfamily)